MAGNLQWLVYKLVYKRCPVLWICSVLEEVFYIKGKVHENTIFQQAKEI